MLHFYSSTKLNIYRDSLNRMSLKSDMINSILPSHGKTPVDKALLLNVLNAVDKIIAGEILGEKHIVYNRDCMRCKFNNFNIPYRKDSLQY